AEIEMRQFLQETRIAAIFARDGAGIVRLQVEPGEDKAPGKMTISARAEEVGDHRGDIDVKVEGEAAKIAFNSKYLQDVLQVLDFLRRERLCEVTGGVGMSAATLRYSLTIAGLERAQAALAMNGYVGPAPVPLNSYFDFVRRQSIHGVELLREQIEESLSELV